MKLVSATSTDGRAWKSGDAPLFAAGKKEPALPSGVSPSLARILRPQAAYRWLLPQIAAITPQYIEAVLRGALAGNHVQQWELFDLMLDSWPELSACQQELTYGVSRLKMIFEPFCEEDEDPTPTAVERCKLVSSALRRMQPDPAADENDIEGTLKDILDGWFRGVTALETDWQTITSPTHGTILAPRCTFWVHPVCFAWGQNGRLGLRVDAQGQISPANLGGLSTFGPANAQPGVVGAFPPHKFLVGIHKAKSGTALGGALLRPLAWWWCAANFSADWLLNLAQIFGLPFRWVNYDPTAAQDTVDRICTMLQNMGSCGWAAFPAGTTMELVENAKQGSDHSPQGELLDRADRYARLLVLGQTMSGSQDASKGGGKAFGAVESEVKSQRIDAAGRYACRVLNTQLLPSILMLNYGDADECPRVRLLEDEEGGYEEAQRDEILSRLMPLSKNFLRKKYGQPEPGEEDDETGGAPEPEEDVETRRRGDAGEELQAKSGDESGHWVAIDHHAGFISENTRSQAYRDWTSGRAAMDSSGKNYRIIVRDETGKKTSRPAPWSKLIKEAHPGGVREFHQAAHAHMAKLKAESKDWSTEEKAELHKHAARAADDPAEYSRFKKLGDDHETRARWKREEAARLDTGLREKVRAEAPNPEKAMASIDELIADRKREADGHDRNALAARYVIDQAHRQMTDDQARRHLDFQKSGALTELKQSQASRPASEGGFRAKDGTVAALARLAAIEDDALFARALNDFAGGLACGFDTSVPGHWVTIDHHLVYIEERPA